MGTMAEREESQSGLHGSVTAVCNSVHTTARVYHTKEIKMPTVKDEWSARLMYDRDARTIWARLLLSFAPLSLSCRPLPAGACPV